MAVSDLSAAKKAANVARYKKKPQPALDEPDWLDQQPAVNRFGLLLKAHRERLALTLDDLAGAIYYNRGSLGQCENFLFILPQDRLKELTGVLKTHAEKAGIAFDADQFTQMWKISHDAFAERKESINRSAVEKYLHPQDNGLSTSASR
jgi:hypothetical protein